MNIASQLTFESWRSILLGLAFELGFITPALTFIAIWTRRPWRERSLVAIPFAAFVWIMLLARNFAMQSSYWRIMLPWMVSYMTQGGNLPDPGSMPSDTPILSSYAQAVDNAQRWGWAAVIVTELVVLLSGALLIVWYRSMAKNPISAVVRAPINNDADTDLTIEPLEPPTRA